MRESLPLLLPLFLAACGGGGAPSALIDASPPARASDGTFALNVNWTVPALNVNGTPLTDIASWRVTYGVSPTSMINVLSVPASQTSIQIQGLAAGTYFVGVETVNSQGERSAIAGPVSGPAR